MDVQEELRKRGQKCSCVRCREVRGELVDTAELQFHDLSYLTPASEEHFLSFDTPDDKLAGYLRLSLPDLTQNSDIRQEMPDLAGAAIIREVHVFGQALPVGGGRNRAPRSTPDWGHPYCCRLKKLPVRAGISIWRSSLLWARVCITRNAVLHAERIIS